MLLQRNYKHIYECMYVCIYVDWTNLKFGLHYLRFSKRFGWISHIPSVAVIKQLFSYVEPAFLQNPQIHLTSSVINDLNDSLAVFDRARDWKRLLSQWIHLCLSILGFVLTHVTPHVLESRSYHLFLSYNCWRADP